MNYLSSVSICKQENPYIFDFYLMHRHLGVERFLFFDREQNNLSEIFKNHKDVEVIYYPEPNRHHYAWAEGVKFFRGKSKWVQFIDIDQVTVPTCGSIPEMLERYEDCHAIGLNWHSFASSGREKPYYRLGPLGIAIVDTYGAYTKRAKANRWVNGHIQSIVQVDHCESSPWGTPHNPPMKPGCNVFNTNKKVVYGYSSFPQLHDVGFIAHYYTRSREEWNKKIEKRRADTGETLNLDSHWKAALDDEGVDTAGDLFDVHNSYMNEVQDLTVADIWNSIG